MGNRILFDSIFFYVPDFLSARARIGSSRFCASMLTKVGRFLRICDIFRAETFVFFCKNDFSEKHCLIQGNVFFIETVVFSKINFYITKTGFTRNPVFSFIFQGIPQLQARRIFLIPYPYCFQKSRIFRRLQRGNILFHQP